VAIINRSWKLQSSLSKLETRKLAFTKTKGIWINARKNRWGWGQVGGENGETFLWWLQLNFPHKFAKISSFHSDLDIWRGVLEFLSRAPLAWEIDSYLSFNFIVWAMFLYLTELRLFWCWASPFFFKKKKINYVLSALLCFSFFCLFLWLIRLFCQIIHKKFIVFKL